METLDRARTILTAAATWIIALDAVAAIALVEFRDLLPEEWMGPIGAGLAILAAIVAVIRRVTPVPQGDRGLLPKA